MNYTSVEQTKLQYAKIPIISPIWTVKTIKLDRKLFFAKYFYSFKLLVDSYLWSSRNKGVLNIIF